MAARALSQTLPAEGKRNGDAAAGGVVAGVGERDCETAEGRVEGVDRHEESVRESERLQRRRKNQ